MSTNEQEWITFKQFTKKNTLLFSEGALRRILLSRKENGATHFVRKVGKKLFLSQKKFNEWLDTYKENI